MHAQIENMADLPWYWVLSVEKWLLLTNELGHPNFFSSDFDQLIISFAWEKTDLISFVENWINEENSSCTVVFSILQFDSRGKQFGSNILNIGTQGVQELFFGN